MNIKELVNQTRSYRRFYQDHKISLNQLCKSYSYEWGRMFSKRLRNALLLQKIVMNNSLRNVGLKMIRPFPSLLRYLTENTRGPAVQFNYDYI